MMDFVYIIIYLALILCPTLIIFILLDKIAKKIIYPLLKKNGDRLGTILFRKRKEREREYMENLKIEECQKENFCLPIDEVVTLAGVGTVVVGTIETGICHEGEQAYLEQEEGRVDTVLGHIDLETQERKPNGAAYRTEHIAVALTGVSEEQVKVGDKLIVENANQAVYD